MADRLRLDAPACGEVALRAAVVEHDGVPVGLREVGRRVAEHEDQTAALQLGAEAGVGARGARRDGRRAHRGREEGERRAPARRYGDRTEQSVLTIPGHDSVSRAEDGDRRDKGNPPFPAGSAMELAGLEPATSWVRSRRSPS